MSRCTGGCCKNFILPFDPMMVENYKRRITAGQKEIIYDQGRYNGYFGVISNNLSQVLDMIIYKRTDWYNPQYARGSKKDKQSRYGSMRNKYNRNHVYTCKHFDGKNCTIYLERPNICRQHGNNNSCTYRGCTNKCESKGSE